jgi:hypothetical protein
LVFASPVVVFSGCQPASPPVRSQIEQIARPYLFDLNRWEMVSLAGKLSPAGTYPDLTLDKAGVEAYFRRAQSARREPGLLDSDESRRIERTLQVWIGEELLRQGINCPLLPDNGLPALFPPLLFKVEQLPSVLIISPRERIELVQRSTLRAGLTPPERMQIEASCDSLQVSSLVDDIAGIATFPAMITPDYGLRNTLEAASEEWLHQYLSFCPLGFGYLTVISGGSDPDLVASLNETLVGMVSEELADDIIRARFPELAAIASNEPAQTGFSFRNEMRTTRLEVDRLLGVGEVRRAEEYMEGRRQLLLRNGYYIRKLNQAYFAFHGTYAYSPASSNPVYESLQKWRTRCGSLREFFVSTSRMTGFKDLKKALGQG